MANQEFLESYELAVNDIIINVSIYSDENEPVPIYNISITNISETTKIILEKIREEFVTQQTKTLEEEGVPETEDIQNLFKKSILKSHQAKANWSVAQIRVLCFNCWIKINASITRR